MIYTLTLNPSLDYIVSVKDFQTGRISRTAKEIIYPGGKGINVSLVLKNLGCDSTALGFIAGFTGDELESLLKDKLPAEFIRVREGLTRINVKIHSNEESEINGQGPAVAEDELQALFKLFDRLEDGDFLVLSGSVPKTVPAAIYMDIMKYLQDRRIKIILDASGELLLNGLKYKPFLIKPNHLELGEIIGCRLDSREEIIQAAKKLQVMGACNVMVSRAGDGAVLVTEQGELFAAGAPDGEVKNAVGAGDSMVAGFIAGYLKSGNYKEAFWMGLCSGSASAFSEELATAAEVEQLLNSINSII